MADEAALHLTGARRPRVHPGFHRCPFSPQGAARVHARIEAILGLLLAQPRLGIRTEDPAIRRISTSPYPYLIFYEVAGDEIIVHAVRHAARDPSDMPGSSRR